VDSQGAQRIGVAFEAMLLQMALRPLAAGVDALGDYGIGLLAQSIAEHDAGGFGALIAARLAPHD
jgi:hypothetical protein